MADINPPQNEKKPQAIEDIFAHEQGKEAIRPPEVQEQPVETAPEVQPEVQPEQQPELTVEAETARRQAPPPAPPAPAPTAPPVKTPDQIKIESILSEHLDELYLQMLPEQQLVFRQKGEETASKIEKLMRDVKLKVKEVLNVIREWLKLIPGINKFFLEQEAKIKTDRLLAFHEQKHRQK